MEKTFKQAVENRRSYYGISNTSPISDKEIENIVEFAIKNVPSAFNSQSTRMVLLLGENHKKLWSIVLETLRTMVKPEAFESTQAKIASFAAGYGSILFFEEQKVVEGLQAQFPSYAHNFPIWSQHTSGMHQFAVWTMLEDAGFGASLQHYNPIIDNEVRRTWNLPESWTLIAQMPFGTPTAQPGEKQFNPIEERVLIFKA